MTEVHTQWFRTVFFLCADIEEEGTTKRVPMATGFLVRTLIADTLSVDYMVTARHCIDEARPYGTLYARLNQKVGSFVEIPTRVDDWIGHPSADVAAHVVLPENLPVPRSDVEAMSITIGPDTFTGGPPTYEFSGNVPKVGPGTFQPNVGHEVYFLGLFSQSAGEERNLPVARFGHISRMPSEIEVDSAGVKSKVVAYLTEFHSMGGHSGSPVFFSWPLMIRIDHANDAGEITDTEWQIRYHNALLGMVSGHYELPVTAEKTGDIVGDIRVRHNSGLAIVTPADAIRELLTEDATIVAEQEKLKQRGTSNTTP